MDDLIKRVRRNLDRFERAPCQRGGLRPAAVAVTLCANENDEACFVITRRAAKLKRHGGQWALPGGVVDPGESAAHAALRELGEEVSLRAELGDLLGVLDDYPTRSGYLITPFVVRVRDASGLDPDPAEVERAYLVPLSELYRPATPTFSSIPESDRPVIQIPMHERLGTSIHAPTAAILYQLREAALEGRPTRVAHYEQPVFAWS